MYLTRIFEAGTGFRVIDTTERSQTGLLTLEPEASNDDPSVNKESDQTLVVLEGELTAEVGSESAIMQAGHAILVPAAGLP